MSKEIDRRIDIEAPPEAVFALLGDSSTWPDWTPIDEHTELKAGDPATGLGEIRRFVNGRVTVEEEIVEREPNRRLSYRLLSGLPVKDYVAVIDLKPSGEGTSLRWHTTFDPKVPGTGWMFRFALDKATAQFVEGLAENAPQARSL